MGGGGIGYKAARHLSGSSHRNRQIGQVKDSDYLQRDEEEGGRKMRMRKKITALCIHLIPRKLFMTLTTSHYHLTMAFPPSFLPSTV